MQVHPLADKSSLSGIRKLIRAELRDVEAPASESFDCLVAVTEACTNALVHGRGDGGPDPEISWEIDRGEARFTIRDFAAHGPSKPPDGPPDKEERDGGYGLKMMRQLMDNVDIRFSPQGTTVLLVKLLQPQAARNST
ncbi:MAG TPA: ATP-binding protein [Actinomycetota bacterium]|nr:ATP-binding protein [Actinomycetota bacterium]